jgi:hypothetical protein
MAVGSHGRMADGRCGKDEAYQRIQEEKPQSNKAREAIREKMRR